MKKKLIVLLTCSALLFSGTTIAHADETDDRIAEIEAQIAELQGELDDLKSQKKNR